MTPLRSPHERNPWGGEERGFVPYIGLTGVFGSGKSTVLGLLASLGACCIDADGLVRAITDSDEAVRREIARRVGPSALDQDGNLDRKEVARIVFSDEHKRADLEALLHPYVFAESERLKDAAYRADPHRVVVLEAPLLFEAGYDRMMDATLVVTCPMETIFTRLVSRGFSKAEVLTRLRSQMSQTEKADRARYRVDNGGSLEDTEVQVRAVYERIRTGRG